jgi:general stress protein 26
VNQTTTIKAIALLTGLTGSSVASATYTLQLAPPNFSPVAGTYASAQSVVLSDSVPGVTIYYTTNGSKPTTSSTRYSNPISVSQPTTINAIAALTGWTSSAVATAAYATQSAVPTFSVAAGTYPAAQSVALSDANSSATIYYTTNGSTPTTSSTRYNGAIAVKQNMTIRAVAAVKGWATSGVGSAAYVLQAATPAFSVPAGSYPATQSVTLSDATSGATIYYTTNGSTPTTSSTRYTGPISVKVTTTLNAIAAVTGWASSSVASATYALP